MVRFHWHGVNHLGMGSKLLTQQEQKTLVDGGMRRLHKGPVIGEASHSKSRSVSVRDRTFARVSSANRCLVVRVDIWPTRTTFHCVYLLRMPDRTQRDSSTESFKKCKRPEEGEGACISWTSGRQAARVLRSAWAVVCRPEHDEMAWDARTGIDNGAKGCVTRLARHVQR